VRKGAQPPWIVGDSLWEWIEQPKNIGRVSENLREDGSSIRTSSEFHLDDRWSPAIGIYRHEIGIAVAELDFPTQDHQSWLTRKRQHRGSAFDTAVKRLLVRIRLRWKRHQPFPFVMPNARH
jgi:hypothetical protein